MCGSLACTGAGNNQPQQTEAPRSSHQGGGQPSLKVNSGLLRNFLISKLAWGGGVPVETQMERSSHSQV